MKHPTRLSFFLFICLVICLVFLGLLSVSLTLKPVDNISAVSMHIFCRLQQRGVYPEFDVLLRYQFVDRFDRSRKFFMTQIGRQVRCVDRDDDQTKDPPGKSHDPAAGEFSHVAAPLTQQHAQAGPSGVEGDSNAWRWSRSSLMLLEVFWRVFVPLTLVQMAQSVFSAFYTTLAFLRLSLMLQPIVSRRV